MVKTDKGYLQMYKIFGKSETEIKERLAGLLECRGGLSVTVRRRAKEVQVLLETEETDEETAKQYIKPAGKAVKKALGDMIYSSKENEAMEEAVYRLLAKYGLTAATVESCTGGLTAAKLVNVPGASEVFHAGFITYSNKAKRKFLGVNKATLKKYGAVSKKTAQEMAEGGAAAAEADACVAITGIAGPDGGTEEKPVGLVYVACCLKNDTVVEECHFRGTRSEIREQSAMYALDLLRRTILKNYR